MEGKDTAGNTGTVSRRLKEKLAVEDIYGVEDVERYVSVLKNKF